MRRALRSHIQLGIFGHNHLKFYITSSDATSTPSYHCAPCFPLTQVNSYASDRPFNADEISHLGQRLPKLSEVYQFWSFEPKGKLVIEFLSSLEKITPSLDDTKIEDIQIPTCGPVENINPDHAPEDRFMDGDNEHLLDFDMTQVSDLNARRESKGLPPDFVRNLCLNRIFTEPWETADLKLALTGLDYLSNLEGTRRMALRDAAHRLHINEYNWREVLDGNYHARSWVCSIEQQEEKIEQFYSTLYVDLRIWVSHLNSLEILEYLKTMPNECRS